MAESLCTPVVGYIRVETGLLQHFHFGKILLQSVSIQSLILFHIPEPNINVDQASRGWVRRSVE
jgi:hypothetical protein